MKPAAQVTGATQHRVQKLVKKYHEKGGIPGLHPPRGPKITLSAYQKAMLEKVW
jgi:hypothetical protein